MQICWGGMMRIVDKTKNNTKEFKSLQLEDIFRWDGRLFMKVSNGINYGDTINAYDFTKKRLTDFTGNTEVELIPAELILHAKGWYEE